MKPFPPPPSALQLRADLLVTLGLVAAALLVYGRTLGYPFITFDDPAYVVGNTHVNGGLSWANWRWAWTSLEQSNWHPLTWLSLMLDAQLYGLNAGGYHLTNLLLHALNGVLIFRWLRGATGALWPAALTGFFFVAHPLHVESVAWVTERKDVLSTLFFCLTLLAYTRYARHGGASSYGLALGLYALGLTAKPMLVTVPPLLLLLDYWPLRRVGTVRWPRLWLEKVPFALLAAASCVVTVIAQRQKAVVPLVALPPVHRAASMALGYGTYLTKTLLPFDLGIYYPYWRARSMAGPICWAVVLVAVTLAVFLLRRAWPFLLVGWCWFLGTLVPVIGVVQVGGQAVADRYTYLPHVGLFIAVFWTGAAAWARWGRAGRRVLAAVTAGAALAALTLSCHQAAYWRSSVAIFEQTARVVRPTARLYYMLGNAQLEANRPAGATESLLKAWQLGSNNDDSIRPLGTLLLRQGRWREAAEVLAPARDRSTATADMLNDLALALVNDGRGDEALAVYRQCNARFPDFALAHFGLAELFQARGIIAAAAAEDEAGLLLRPDWLPAMVRLVWNYAHSADPETREIGLTLARRAVAQTGGRDSNCLGLLAFNQAVNGHWDEAVDAAERALTAAQRPGAPVDAEAGCREQLDTYRRHRLPP